MFLRLRHIFALFCIIFCSFSSFGSGYFMVVNFPKEQYSAGAQNWCITQDALGKVYVGNRDGLLINDGARWKKAYLANYTTIRSLYYDEQNSRMYAGGSEELGYFTSDSISGNLVYTSILDLLPANRPVFSEIWNIYKLGDNVWFQADNYLFCYSGNSVSVLAIPERISTSAVIGNSLYIALEDGRLLKLSNGTFNQIKGSERLIGKKITAILPLGNHNDLIIGTAFDGLYRFDGESVIGFSTDINSFLANNQLFCAACDDNNYVFGTVNNGAVVIDFTTGQTNYMNKETGLQNNTILAADFDNAGNVWLCLDNGLDYVVCNSALNKLIGTNNSIGAGYCSMIENGNILYGTNQGLFSTPFPYHSAPTPPKFNQNLQGQIWSINPTPHGLLIGTDAGIYHYIDGQYNHLPHTAGTYMISPLADNSNLALASTYRGFCLLSFEKGKWSVRDFVDGCSDLNGKFLFAKDSTIWISHWRKGVYHLRLDSNSNKMTIISHFNSENGLPSDENNAVALFGDQVVFSTRDGFFTPTSDGQTIKPFEELNAALSEKYHGALQTLSDGSIAYFHPTGIYIVSQRADGGLICEKVASGKISEELLPGFTHLNLLPDGRMIISTQDGFNQITGVASNTRSWHPQPFVSAVYANQDSLVFASSIDGKSPHPIVLPYNLNSLKFEFAYPDFESGTAEYSSYLENYEQGWSQFSPEATREYTRLSEGDYVMHLRVRDNDTGQYREAALGFTITAPWYRSTLARICYVIALLLTLSLIGAAVKNRLELTRRQAELRNEKALDELRKQSEKEALVKDIEIANLKTEQLEQDILHKSRELSSTAMNLIRKNEILSDIATQLRDLQQLTSNESASRALIMRNIAKLQSSVEKSISGSNDWDTFNKNFDVVYNEFTQHLSELHPNLTTADRRLCCYIRMGLSSKEIAPLLSISAKSVEMARYRLRRKLELPEKKSLSDYLNTL